jgi:predicted negative regulator of RcsB-dependent stress response
MTRTGAAARPAFEDRTESFYETVRTHWRKGAFALVGAAAVAGGVALYRGARDTKAERAEQALAQAQQSLVSGNAPLAQTDLQKVVKQYEGTSAGVQGTLLLAQLFYDQGKPAEGLKLLEEAQRSGAAERSRAAIFALTAAGYEQQGKPAEAAAQYRRAAEAAEYELDRANFKADAARAYMAAGNKEAAKGLWTELSADPRGPLAGEARVRLGELTAVPAPKS